MAHIGLLPHKRKPIRPNRLKDVKFAKTTRVEKKVIK
jgi:hypothetical protein